MSDNRPAECRFRLQDEGKSYPRSSCKACGRHAFNGLGNHCHLADICPSPEVVKELVEVIKYLLTDVEDDLASAQIARAVLAKLEGVR